MLLAATGSLLTGALSGVSQRIFETRGVPAASVQGWNGTRAIGFRDEVKSDVIGIP
jgi:hypothetical protein